MTPLDIGRMAQTLDAQALGRLLVLFPYGSLLAEGEPAGLAGNHGQRGLRMPSTLRPL